MEIARNFVEVVSSGILISFEILFALGIFFLVDYDLYDWKFLKFREEIKHNTIVLTRWIVFILIYIPFLIILGFILIKLNILYIDWISSILQAYIICYAILALIGLIAVLLYMIANVVMYICKLRRKR